MKKLALIPIMILSLHIPINSFAEVPILDNATTSIINNKITSDPILKRSNVIVTTNNGIVKLDGVVQTDNEAALLIQTAQSASGVKDIDTSALKVAESKQPFVDTVITAKIKGLFLQAKLFGTQDLRAATINVSTNNGIVSLSGIVNSTRQLERAIAIAKTVNGVKSVESIIKVIR